MCVNLEAASIAHAHVCTHTCRAAPLRRHGYSWASGGLPGAARSLPARSLPGACRQGLLASSSLPAQAASSRPGASSVQLLLILSLESQILAVVWENKCAERAEYLMGPFSDRNDSGNEPPLSYGCQGLLLGWLDTLPGAALPAGACSALGRGMRCHGLCRMLGGG